MTEMPKHSLTLSLSLCVKKIFTGFLSPEEEEEEEEKAHSFFFFFVSLSLSLSLLNNDDDDYTDFMTTTREFNKNFIWVEF